MTTPNPRAIYYKEPNLLIPGRKPVGAVKVDWGNSLSRGLVGCYVLNKLPIVNLVNSAVTAMSPSEGVIVRDNAYFERSVATGLYIDLYTDDIMPIGTVMINCYAPNTSASQYTIAESETSSDNNLWVLKANLPNNRLQSGINGSSWFDQASHTALDEDNSIVSWSWDVSGNTERHISTTARTTRSVSVTQPTNYPIHIGAREAYGDLQCETLYYMFFWNRFITDDEEAAVRSDPYQFLVST